MKTRWSATCRTAPSISIRARPRSTRRCMPMCRRPMSTTCIPDAVIAIAASKDQQGADAERSSATRSAGCRGSGPGFELGLWLEKFCRENPDAQGRRARKPRPVHLGRHAEGMLRDDDLASSTRPSTGSSARPQASRPSAARRSSRCRAAERRAIAAQADAGDPRPDLRRRDARSAISTTSAAVLEFVGSKDLRPLAALGTSCPDHFLRTKIRPLVDRFRSGQSRYRQAVIAGLRRDRRLPRRLRRPTTTAASMRIARRCAIPTRWSIWCPASA